MASEITIFSTGYALIPNAEKTVLDAARERVSAMFDKYDFVAVSFSGGKDSTVVLQLCLDEARKRERLPLTVTMFDEEVIDPDTVAYCKRMQQNPDLDFMWLCVPVRHTLRSQLRDHWITWDETQRDVWARPMPAGAITVDKIPGFQPGMSIPDALACLFADKPLWASVGGIRVEESFNRRRALAQSGDFANHREGLGGNRIGYDWIKPIWDWKWRDVWRYLIQNEIDHSHYYDRMFVQGISPQNQRVAPWGNVAASRDTTFYPSFYPEFWEAATRRLPELLAQARYGRTTLFRKNTAKPIGLTWQEYTYRLLEELQPDARAFWEREIKSALMRWRCISTLPFPEEAIFVGKKKYTQCWKKMATNINKNDLIRGSGGTLMSRDRL